MNADREAYKQALLQLRNKGRLRKTKYVQMLKTQYEAEGRTVTATELAEAVGFKNYNAANLQYGALGHEIAELIGYDPPKRPNGTPIWHYAIATSSDSLEDKAGQYYEFTMRPELAAALEEMHWVR